MRIYLGLGSNLGDRKQFLEKALTGLKSRLHPSHFCVSPIYETPALMPTIPQTSWNQPFLNLCVELECSVDPLSLLEITQQIECESGRIRNEKWAPRELDIDILIYGDCYIRSESINLPHPEIQKRAFVLDPLKDLNPNLLLNDLEVLHRARRHPQHSPVLMGIFNATPDSFSDGRHLANETVRYQELQNMIENHIGIIDIGGESTRPNAFPIDADIEWARIKPPLEYLRKVLSGHMIKPQISVDTRNRKTAARAIELGADIVNDVSGSCDSEMMSLIRDSGRSYVLTHSLGIPADPENVISQELDVTNEIKNWFKQKISSLESFGIKRNKIIIDPGIGFGKTAIQSQSILQNIHSLYEFNCRVLVGHSRKSFLAPVTSFSAPERDFESIGASLALCRAGVDILRVHAPVWHKRALLGWNHVRSTHE